MVRRIFILLLVSFAAPAFALSPAEEQIAQGIFHSVMSPYCPGRLLTDCPSTQAHELKEKIRTDIAQGKSETAIEEDLVALFGETVWAAPRARGFGLAAWITPFLFLLVGALLIFSWLRSRNRAVDNAPIIEATGLSPAMRRKIEEELNN
jgi:cytochrome c-type biogenesis protein CcmH